MAKNKHEKLAQHLKAIIKGIDSTFDQVEALLEIVQFHFYEKVSIIERPQLNEKVFVAMMKSHALGLRYYSPNEEIRSACARLPCLGIVVKKPLIMQSEMLITTSNETGKWGIPWGVKLVLPNQNKALIEKARLEALLYCPDPSEVSLEIHWFEKEDLVNTFTNRILSFLEENQDYAIIEANLVQLARTHYVEIVKKWSQECDKDNISKKLETVLHAPFAPDDTCSVAIAYERIRYSTRERRLRNYQHLKMMWRNELERLIFHNLKWPPGQKIDFLRIWEEEIFLKPKKYSSKNGRWDQCQAIDREIAAKIIKYFVDLFLVAPNSRKQCAEIACFLWICIWASQKNVTAATHLHEIHRLTTKQLDRETMTLQIGKNKIDISNGLCTLLTYLLGKGRGERNCPLFENIPSLNYLQGALKNASSAILGDSATPVLPASFLLFPHPFKDRRLSANRRQAISKANKVQYNLTPSRNDLFKALKTIFK